MFDVSYPRAGGGEDVDFCFRAVFQYHGKAEVTDIVSVPNARVHHPWWGEGSAISAWKQVIGWASGDSICLVRLPQHTFLTLPNWIEAIVLVQVFWQVSLVYAFVLFGSDVLYSLLQGQSLLSSGIRQSQQVTRLFCAFTKGDGFAFCRRMDFFLGREPGISRQDKLEHAFRFAFMVAILFLLSFVV